MDWKQYQESNGVQVHCTACGQTIRISVEAYRGEKEAECPNCGAINSWED